MSDERTQVIAGPFWTRRKARKLERNVQAVIDAGGGYSRPSATYMAAGVEVPKWARGVRVERMGTHHAFAAVGRVTWCLVATSHRGS